MIITLIRILFGAISFGLLLFLGMWVARTYCWSRGIRNVGVIKAMALCFNTVLLAVFFTLWCVKMGIV